MQRKGPKRRGEKRKKKKSTNITVSEKKEKGDGDGKNEAKEEKKKRETPRTTARRIYGTKAWKLGQRVDDLEMGR